MVFIIKTIDQTKKKQYFLKRMYRWTTKSRKANEYSSKYMILYNEAFRSA